MILLYLSAGMTFRFASVAAKCFHKSSRTLDVAGRYVFGRLVYDDSFLGGERVFNAVPLPGEG